jgi:hypothetical protein
MRWIVIVIFLLALAPVRIHAQEPGAISGIILDNESCAPLSGITIVAGPGNALLRPIFWGARNSYWATSESDGGYSMKDLPSGEYYTIIANYTKEDVPYYSKQEVIFVAAGRTETMNFQLNRIELLMKWEGYSKETFSIRNSDRRAVWFVMPECYGWDYNWDRTVSDLPYHSQPIIYAGYYIIQINGLSCSRMWLPGGTNYAKLIVPRQYFGGNIFLMEAESARRFLLDASTPKYPKWFYPCEGD